MAASFKKTLETHIKPDSTVIIGVSGGSDSIYLLDQCLNLAKEKPFTIIVAHINHNLRGKESDNDEVFVKKTAQKNGLTFEVKKLKPILKGNTEELCRNARYTFFEKMRQKHKATWILTAHHLQDNIETVLFNLVRGSFLNGLKGIAMVSPQRHLLRPMLNLHKEEILTYLKKNKLKYCTDKTNLDTRFSRNLLRHNVIPQLQKINSNFSETFAKNILNLQEAAEFIEEYASNWLLQNAAQTTIPLESFIKLSPIVQKTILATLYKNLYGNTNKFNQKHLEQLLQIIHSQKANLKKEFGDKHFIAIRKNAKNNKKYLEVFMG